MSCDGLRSGLRSWPIAPIDGLRSWLTDGRRSWPGPIAPSISTDGLRSWLDVVDVDGRLSWLKLGRGLAFGLVFGGGGGTLPGNPALSGVLGGISTSTSGKSISSIDGRFGL
jgi:hypothetical protein